MTDQIQQYRILAERLYKRTVEDTLKWEIEWGTSNPVTSLGGYQVKLKRGETAEGEPIVLVQILDKSDEFVDGFSDATLSQYQTNIEEISGYWTLLDRLYDLAYRKAKGADKALEAIINDLDDEVPF